MNESEDLWNELFEQLPVDAAAQKSAQQQVRSRVLDAYDNSAPAPPLSGIRKAGQLLMKHKIAQWSVAALCIVAGALIFQATSPSAFALEELVGRIVNAKTARWDMKVRMDGYDEQTIKVSVIPGRCRQEFETMTVILDWNAGKSISLMPEHRQAIVMPVVKSKDYTRHINQFEIVRDGLREAMEDPEQNVESLGLKTFGDHELTGFRFKTATQQIIVWADPSTQFPVRIEFPIEGSPASEVVMLNYEFDIDLDESLFDTELPEGYRVLDPGTQSAATEDDFIASLRMACEYSEGEFPPGLDAVAVGKITSHIMLTRIENTELDTSNLTNEQLAEYTRFEHGFTFATMMGITGESDVHYAGAGVKLNSDNRPIFWYRPKDSKTFRVIFADLTVREQSDAPQVSEAVKVNR